MSFKRGRPVIATPVGGLPEQIRDGETGLLTEAVSRQAIAASIKRLAGDRALLRRLAENALRHAEQDLSWKCLAPRFSEVLEKVAQRRRR
jgi:glycosyltransferase involved in cell wall biosynthesis